MLALVLKIPFFWESCVQLLSKPVLWLSQVTARFGDRIADKNRAHKLKLILHVLLAVETIVFAIYALQSSIIDIVKNLIGCSVYGGFLDMYETLFLGSNRGIHLWLTSGFLWLLDAFVSQLVERSEQPKFMKIIHSVALALFFSAIISPVYTFIADLVQSAFSNHSVLSILLLLLLAIPVLFAVISGLWVSIANCYDMAFIVIVIFGLWAIFPKMWTDDMTAIIVFVLLFGIFAITKHYLSKAEDAYSSLSIFHYRIRENADKSTFCSILFFIGSIYSMVYFISLVGILFGSAEIVDMMRSWYKP